MNLITVKTFDNAFGAHILQARLEDEGIVAHIHDENIMSIDPLLNIAVGGVKIKVDEPDVEKALAIIAEIDDTPMTNDKEEVIKCPKCESTDLYSDFKSMKSAKGVIAAIISFMLIVFPIYYKRVYRCKVCATEFKGNPERKKGQKIKERLC